MAVQETGKMQIIFYFYLQDLLGLLGKLGETEREDSKVPHLYYC